MTDDVARVKSRLAPWLDEPYFTVVTPQMTQAAGRCTHTNMGVILNEADRTVTCRGCRAVVDAFDALTWYAQSEKRLLGVAATIEAHQQRERERKLRETARRPFLRRVTAWTARRDTTLKAEPIIGWTLTLECKHTKPIDGERRPKKVTCRRCQDAATVLQSD